MSTRQKNCSLCHTAFGCGKTNGHSCWCSSLPNIISPSEHLDCLCPDCLKKEIQERIRQFTEAYHAGTVENIAANFKSAKAGLNEGIDYYLENGNYVFTEWYHLQRGHCCGNGCRHCPY